MHDQEVLPKPHAVAASDAAPPVAAPATGGGGSLPTAAVSSSSSSSNDTAVPPAVQEELDQTEEAAFPPQTRTMSSRSTATMNGSDDPNEANKDKTEADMLQDLKNRPTESQALWRCAC